MPSSQIKKAQVLDPDESSTTTSSSDSIPQTSTPYRGHTKPSSGTGTGTGTRTAQASSQLRRSTRSVDRIHVATPRRLEVRNQRQKRCPMKTRWDIKYFQKAINLLMQDIPFNKVVREVVDSVSDYSIPFQGNALLLLQEASEAYMITLPDDDQFPHAKRVTLMRRYLCF